MPPLFQERSVTALTAIHHIVRRPLKNPTNSEASRCSKGGQNAPNARVSRCWRGLQSRCRRAALGMSTRLIGALATPSSERAKSTRSPCCVRMPQVTRSAGQTSRLSQHRGLCAWVCLRVCMCRLRVCRSTWRASRNGTAILVSAARRTVEPSASLLHSIGRASFRVAGVCHA